MENIPSSTTGWIWWLVSVVIMGVLINLFSSFIYPRIEKLIAKQSESRRQKLEAQQRKFQDQVENLVENPDRITDLKIDLILSHLKAILYVALGLIVINVFPIIAKFFYIRYLDLLFYSLSLGVVALLTSPILLLMNKIRRTNRRTREAERRITEKL